MRTSMIKSLTATSIVSFASLSAGLNIIVSNDDGWGSANIREFYKALNDAGHNAWIVAPVTQNSGKGGTTVFTSEANITSPVTFDTVPLGAPSFGTDPNDSHIWYYNGTPAAVTFFALDYVVPNFWNGTKPDILVAGPNEGGNTGPFFYTLSGTIGATYAAVERGIPAIAFSAADGTGRLYTEVNATAPGGSDPATITGKLGVKLVEQLAANAKGGPLLPAGYGISVNYPYITSLKNDSCVNPPFIQTRLTGGATIDKAVLNETTGIFDYANASPDDGLNTCINGDCSLPGDTDIVKTCQTAVSVFTVDYDAPNCQGSKPIRNLVQPLVGTANGTGSGSNSSSGGPNTTYHGPTVVSANGAGRLGGFQVVVPVGILTLVALLLV
ncbi:MAG: hypothetical protein M4579_004113 [Chaenotheca gracillima]|nr:MAG: hypothetical protein M4579_004113 [Chaenotheca gracillima]